MCIKKETLIATLTVNKVKVSKNEFQKLAYINGAIYNRRNVNWLINANKLFCLNLESAFMFIKRHTFIVAF